MVASSVELVVCKIKLLRRPLHAAACKRNTQQEHPYNTELETHYDTVLWEER